MPNIELYELLKRELSEEAARRIAEVVAKTEDLATKADVAELRGEFRAGVAEVKAYIDSRLLRFTATIVVPMTIAMLAAVGTMITVLLQL